MARIRTLFIALAAFSLLVPLSLAGGKIPDRPEKLKYGKLKFELPDADTYRFALDNGIVAFIGENHELPLVRLGLTIRTGSFVEPQDKPGVASLTGSMIRSGGTKSMSAEAFDERADFLAANLSSSVGQTSGSATMNCTTPTLNECLDLFFEMVRYPRFQEDRLELEKSNRLESMKQRNDDARSIASREWQWLMRGRDHFSARQLTGAQLEAITHEDLVAFHATFWRPENFILTISGDVDTKAILKEMNTRFADWKAVGPAPAWPPKASKHLPIPGVYFVDKDIPQGRVNIGHLGLQDANWSNPDRYAIALMNEILGGGGFTSRITKKVRSDEGLAYSAWSSYRIGSWAPGLFSVGYQSKSSSVALAAKLSIAEIQRIQAEGVSEEELNVAKAAYIDTFPQRFDSIHSVVSLFANDEYIGRNTDYWKNYQENYQKVTVKDIQRVAKSYLHPDKLVFLIVGKWDEIKAGDADGRASMKLFYDGKATEIPLRDPLTLETTQ